MQDDRKSTPKPPDTAEEGREAATPPPPDRPKEIGGRGGLDPTRFGDWEKNGRCIDF
jgi:hypothetical protein